MLPNLQLSGLSRMADAERWGEAVARGLGWAAGTFANTLGANRATANELSLEESPVAVSLIDLAIRCPSFRGTMQELLQTLTALSRSNPTRSSDWPKSPRALSVKLRHLAPQLRSIGIEVEFERERLGRFVTIGMNEQNETFARGHESPIIGDRLRAYLEEQTRTGR